VVSGQLHDEGRRLAREHLGLLEDDTGADDRRHANEVAAGGEPGASAEERADDHADERHLRAAGDERRGHDGHAPVAFIFNGTRRHDARDTAARADKDGDKALAGETEAAEHAVEHEGDARHVAARLHEREQEEQHEHLRHKAEHRAHARDDTVENEAAEPVGAADGVERVPDQHGNAGHPNAVVGGVGLLEAVFFKVGHRVRIGHGVGLLLVRAVGHGVEPDRYLALFERFFVLDGVGN